MVKNEILLTGLADNYLSRINKNFDLCFNKFIGKKEKSKVRLMDVWQKDTFSVVALNRDWLLFLDVNNISDNYSKRFVIAHLIIGIAKYKTQFKYKVGLDVIGDFDFFRHTNYKTIIDFFESELKLQNQLSKKEISEPTKKSIDKNDISWENQTELSELIYVLFHSKRVLKNGNPIEIKDLTELFNKTFNTNIKTPTDLVNKSIKSYKKRIDGKTFISELNSILEVYKKQTLDKDSK